MATQDITVAALQIGNITGTVETPDKPIRWHWRAGDAVLARTSPSPRPRPLCPALSGTGRVPADGDTRRRPPSSSPASPPATTCSTLPASAVQGTAVSVPVTVTTGQTATPTLTLTYPAWTEGTPDAKISDPLTGTALDPKWTAATSACRRRRGARRRAAAGLTVMADGAGWVRLGQHARRRRFLLLRLAERPGGRLGSLRDRHRRPRRWAGRPDGRQRVPGRPRPYAANFVVSAHGRRRGSFLRAARRTARTPSRFGETAAGTDPNNGGTQPNLPVTLKIRKVGRQPLPASTPRTAARRRPHRPPGSAVRSDGLPAGWGWPRPATRTARWTTATYQNFVFAPLARARADGGPVS